MTFATGITVTGSQYQNMTIHFLFTKWKVWMNVWFQRHGATSHTTETIDLLFGIEHHLLVALYLKEKKYVIKTVSFI